MDSGLVLQNVLNCNESNFLLSLFLYSTLCPFHNSILNDARLGRLTFFVNAATIEDVVENFRHNALYFPFADFGTPCFLFLLGKRFFGSLQM